MKKDNGSNAPLISVIIPVYNVEEYLVDCLGNDICYRLFQRVVPKEMITNKTDR